MWYTVLVWHVSFYHECLFRGSSSVHQVNYFLTLAEFTLAWVRKDSPGMKITFIFVPTKDVFCMPRTCHKASYLLRGIVLRRTLGYGRQFIKWQICVTYYSASRDISCLSLRLSDNPDKSPSALKRYLFLDTRTACIINMLSLVRPVVKTELKKVGWVCLVRWGMNLGRSTYKLLPETLLLDVANIALISVRLFIVRREVFAENMGGFVVEFSETRFSMFAPEKIACNSHHHGPVTILWGPGGVCALSYPHTLTVGAWDYF